MAIWRRDRNAIGKQVVLVMLPNARYVVSRAKRFTLFVNPIAFREMTNGNDGLSAVVAVDDSP